MFALPDKRAHALATLLATYDRVAIVGGPRTGKTTLSERVNAELKDDRFVLHNDDLLKSFDWTSAPFGIIERLAPYTRFVVEGVQTARALRKGLKVDAVIYLDDPKVLRNKGQVSMAKGIATVFAEWRAAHPFVPLVHPDRGLY